MDVLGEYYHLGPHRKVWGQSVGYCAICPHLAGRFVGQLYVIVRHFVFIGLLRGESGREA